MIIFLLRNIHVIINTQYFGTGQQAYTVSKNNYFLKKAIATHTCRYGH